ncbi:hypothetical protein VCRA2121O337_50036 [Vibrio crassostreae]|nr:hypothetical protein VCRA2120E331_50037 [Vibrio crassostreae]CAK3599611.1 hypothetical protein VCRA2122O338_50037 [Vibrio crassostreae]CAK3661700.1 hypothetical protein VCRA2122O340_50039 [Vibrio crassostreae]CAK3923573.1 hypothetical protein VCRA2121O337_50036 [Vibrio crassostreae]CAK3924259.1 hypothetical protein VCRA2121O335_50036 [Vibrio crassostreae]
MQDMFPLLATILLFQITCYVLALKKTTPSHQNMASKLTIH